MSVGIIDLVVDIGLEDNSPAASIQLSEVVRDEYYTYRTPTLKPLLIL